MSRVVNHACASVLSLVANSTGSTPGRAKAWKAATPASPSPLPGTTVAAGAQTKARQTDNAASPSRHTSHGRNASGATTFAEGRQASRRSAVNDGRVGCSPEGLAPAAADRRSPAKSLVLMTNDADRKGSRALAVEGRANRAVLCAPERGAARERWILRHLLSRTPDARQAQGSRRRRRADPRGATPPSLDDAQMRSRPGRRLPRHAGGSRPQPARGPSSVARSAWPTRYQEPKPLPGG